MRQTSHFIPVATSANIAGTTTEINNAATNGQPNALLFVTPNWDPGGVCGGCVYDVSPIGVFYDSGTAQWTVFNEDHSVMQAGVAFNVLVVPSASSTAFVQTAIASNSSGNATVINSAASNGHPSAVLQATQRWNGAFEDHAIGVYYNGSSWGIFNEDEGVMDTSGDATFNVLVGSAQTGGAKTFVQKAKSANISGDSTSVNAARTNGDPNAFVIETPNLDPNGLGGTSDASATGMYFDGSRMTVFNEDESTMAKDEAFNLLMYNS